VLRGRSRVTEEARYTVAVGSDDAGVNLKDFVRDRLGEDPRVREVRDFGVADASDKTPYPIICIKAAEAVARGEADRAVLFGGTGLGEAISANKVKGIRAVVAHDPYSVERSILSNNCQVLCLGERVIAPELADRIVGQWLGYEFDESSPSAEKVAVIAEYEERGSLPE
jgi:ribose 5-phosphate isomerase B